MKTQSKCDAWIQWSKLEKLLHITARIYVTEY